MSDTKASETNEIDADSLLSSDMKSTINNCDETNNDDKKLDSNNDESINEEVTDLPTNGHDEEVNGSSKVLEGVEKEKEDVKQELTLPDEVNSLEQETCIENSKHTLDQDTTSRESFSKEDPIELDIKQDKQETEEVVDFKQNEPSESIHTSTNELQATLEMQNGKDTEEEPGEPEPGETEPSSMTSENVLNENFYSKDEVSMDEIIRDSEESQDDTLTLEKSEEDDSKESNMDIDQTDSLDNVSESDKTTISIPKTSSNVITEVVVGNNDEVTLDLSKTLINGMKESTSDKPVSSESSSLKRDLSSSSDCMDLSLPSKRQTVTNGLGEINGVPPNEVDQEDDFDNQEELLMPPTPPQEDLEDLDRIKKLKMLHRLRQQLLNEDSKLVLLKKIRQSQLKENISQSNNSQHHNSGSTATNSIQAGPTPVGINLSSSMRDVNNLLTSQYQASLSQSGLNSALNFSTSHNSKSTSNLVNNNMAHINSHPNTFGKNNLINPNMAHQAPLQAHLSKSMAHVKSNSVLNSPFASSLGRSPYNHLNSHLSAPPPSLHGSNNSNKRMSSYEAPNLNTAHSSHRPSPSSSASQNRSSLATPPNIGYSQSQSSSSKFNQHISQSASPSSTVHNQMGDTSRTDPLLAQRQAANVKQVLRKQLEKMPQPKIPPPEMHFIPNPNNAEFICYLGLEKVVDFLTGNNQVFHPPEPFECVQCGTDFTPVWKWKDRSDPTKPSVICEKCVSKNMKKAVTDEQTKRINTFSKAYEELEKQMASAAASAVSSITPPTAAISPSQNSVSASASNSAQHQHQHQHSTSSNLASSSHNSSSGSSHNLFGSNNSASTVAAMAAAAANMNSLGTGLSGLQHQQAHSNSPLSSLSQQQLALMASLGGFQTQASNSNAAHQMSTPPAAHSSSRSTSNSFAANLAAYNASNNNANAQSAAATLALLQQLQQQQQPKANTAAQQSLLLAQQLQAFSALASGGNAANANNAAMAQLLGFPNIFYSSLLAATIANQKSSNQSTSNSNMNAAAAAVLQRQLQGQLLMDMFPGASSGNSRSGSGSNGKSSLGKPQR